MKCKKCGSEHLKLEQRSKETDDIMKATQVALVCGDCGFWQKWCQKEERKRYIKKTMKNREWLNSLSDKEFVEKFRHNGYLPFCDMINYKLCKKAGGNCTGQCVYVWLQAEHEEANQ